jgi:HEAT repeat protein
MADNEWFILIGQERQGPMSVHDVRYLLTRRTIDGGTLVWKEGMDSWVRLREIDEFQPKKKGEPEEAQAESEEAAPPAPTETTDRSRLLQRLIPALLTLGLVGGAAYVFITDEPPVSEKRASTSSPVKRRTRSPQDLVDGLKRGERGSKTELIRAGNRAVPALIQALIEKGSPLDPRNVRAILIEIGPSSSSAIGDALEGLDLSKAAAIILVEVLGEFGGLTSVPALIIALGNPDIEVQERAIVAIGKLNPDFGPALARHLTSPVEELSKQQRVNLAKALGEHRSPASIPNMQKAQQSERDAEVIAALAKAVEQISRNPRTSEPVPTVVIQNQKDSRPPPDRDTEPAKNISVHVSASATATATAESEDKEEEPETSEPEASDESDNAEQAERLAEEGRKLQEQGKEDEALEKYRQAYALNPIRAYLIIILALEGTPDSTASPADSTAPPPLPEIDVPREISLSEIYDELDQPEPDLGSYSGSLGSWSGTIDNDTPFSRDGRRDLYVVKGPTGQDFIAAIRRRELASEDVGTDQTWRGTLQGFRVTDVDGESRMLPVLLVE